VKAECHGGDELGVSIKGGTDGGGDGVDDFY